MTHVKTQLIFDKSYANGSDHIVIALGSSSQLDRNRIYSVCRLLKSMTISSKFWLNKLRRRRCRKQRLGYYWSAAGKSIYQYCYTSDYLPTPVILTSNIVSRRFSRKWFVSTSLANWSLVEDYNIPGCQSTWCQYFSSYRYRII